MSTQEWLEYVPAVSRPRSDQAVIILGKGPQFRLSAAAVQALGSPSHVLLLFDRVGRRIGLRAASGEVKHAFPLKRYGGAKVSTVSGAGFFKWAGIDYSQRREIPIETASDDVITAWVDERNDVVGEFDEFTFKGTALAQQEPNVSISRSGNMTLNRASMSLINSAERVVLLYNPAARRIGLRPATDERHARPIRPSSSQKTWTLSAEGFLKQFDVPHTEGRSFEPSLEGGVLVIDLNQPKPPRLRREGAGVGNAGRA